MNLVRRLRYASAFCYSYMLVPNTDPLAINYPLVRVLVGILMCDVLPLCVAVIFIGRYRKERCAARAGGGG